MRVRAHARQQQSVAAAAKLFSRESCDGITARHFPSKEQLYWAAGSQQAQHPPFCRAPLSSALPERELSQHLIRIYTADLRELISTCIGQGAGRGWQRKTDSEVGAGGFMEMALCRSLIQELFAGDRHQNLILVGLEANSRTFGWTEPWLGKTCAVRAQSLRIEQGWRKTRLETAFIMYASWAALSPSEQLRCNGIKNNS